MRKNLLQLFLLYCTATLVGAITAQAQTATVTPLYARLEGAPVEYRIHNRDWQRAAEPATEPGVLTMKSPENPLRNASTSPLLRQATRPAGMFAGEKAIGQADGARSIIKYGLLTSFGYERVLQNNRSIYGGISLYSVNAVFTRVTAIGLKGEYRFYGLIKSSPKQAPEGFWVAPTVLFWNVSARDLDDGYTEHAFVAQLGGIAGYQWIFNEKISLEPALGVSLTAVGSGTESILGAGIVPLFALRVGYVLN